MNRAKYYTLVQLFWILAGLCVFEEALAVTEFTCHVNAVDATGESPSVRGARCAAILVYSNTESEERDNVLRECMITGNANSCTVSFDDSDVQVSHPFSANILNHTSMEKMASNLSSPGCMGASIDRDVDVRKGGKNFNIVLTYNLLCPSVIEYERKITRGRRR